MLFFRLYACTLRSDVYILNRQRAASYMHAILRQFKTSNCWLLLLLLLLPLLLLYYYYYYYYYY